MSTPSITFEHTPTAEQQAIIDAFGTGDNLAIEAGAGAAKTSTLVMIAQVADAEGRKGVYLAYNKAIASDAQGRFPSSVDARTAHSFAYRAVIGHNADYARKLRNAARMPAWKVAQYLNIRQSITVNRDSDTPSVLDPKVLARLTMGAVRNFCNSDDAEVQASHIQIPEGAEKERDEIRSAVLPYARQAWADILSKGGQLKFEHDHYLKIWALSNPTLPGDYIMLDEAQDSNPVIAGVVMRQNAQKIVVGDRAQSIYGWRGAVDAMVSFEGRRLTLSQSFRFGQAVADEANKWLGHTNTTLRIRGFEKVASQVTDEPLAQPTCIICRTNAGVIEAAMSAQAQGLKAAVVGGTKQIADLAEAANDLMSGMGTGHPELVAFRSWTDLVDYVKNDEGGSDLRVLVRLVETYGVPALLEVCRNTIDEKSNPDVVVTTAHKSKGREWAKVQIGNDFSAPKQDADGISRTEAMLAYVTVTRAKEVLSRGSLNYIDLF